MKQLLVATRNVNKLREIKELLRDLPIDVISLNEYNSEIPDVIEDGETFVANAEKKASTIAQVTNQFTLSDDSGLCIDYLGGAPGVYSARYAGDVKDDSLNRKKVLCALNDLPDEERTAHFACAIAFAAPNTIIDIVEGTVSGTIARTEMGEHGFGYDSIFYYPPLKKTFAQISSKEKNEISHRANALKLIKNVIMQYLKNNAEIA